MRARPVGVKLSGKGSRRVEKQRQARRDFLLSSVAARPLCRVSRRRSTVLEKNVDRRAGAGRLKNVALWEARPLRVSRGRLEAERQRCPRAVGDGAHRGFAWAEQIEEILGLGRLQLCARFFVLRHRNAASIGQRSAVDDQTDVEMRLVGRSPARAELRAAMWRVGAPQVLQIMPVSAMARRLAPATDGVSYSLSGEMSGAGCGWRC